MSRVTTVYQLSRITDDPRFEGFALAESPSILGRDSLDDDLTPGFVDADDNPNWRQPALGDAWAMPKATGRVSEFNDYPCVDMVIPAFSERAVGVLKDFLEPNGELLPLETGTDSDYFAYNILTVSDALDREKSCCEFWCDPPTTADEIDFFVFESEKVEGLSIFRIRELPTKVFVTNVFQSRVESSNLEGFVFNRVWPLPEGADWRTLDQEFLEDRRRLKQHTLVLMLPLRGTAKEKRLIRDFENALDSTLRVDRIDANYLGSYEGSDDSVGKECRLFLSCPDVDRLLKHIRADIENLSWPSDIKVCSRYGGMYEEGAKEVFSVI